MWADAQDRREVQRHQNRTRDESPEKKTRISGSVSLSHLLELFAGESAAGMPQAKDTPIAIKKQANGREEISKQGRGPKDRQLTAATVRSSIRVSRLLT